MCVVGLGAPSIAQPNSSSNWYFGQRAGLMFRNVSVESLADGQINTSEGCASISDPLSGDLLFYTDGTTVWNRLHEVMPNGSGLFGDVSTSQSALIVPAPGKPNVYYVFNPAAVTSINLGIRCLCLYYSIVDLRADAGFGDVVKKNALVLNDITEHLTATADCNGDGWWIVVRSRSTRHFYSLHLTRDELTPIPVVSDAGNPTLIVRDAGQMHISPDSRKLVITSASGNSQLYDFNAQTGKVSNGINLFKVDVLGSHYGAAFSIDSRKLYIAVANEENLSPTFIYQFSVDRQNALDVADSKFRLGPLPGNFTWVPMQLASDGRIYIGLAGKPSLARIDSPEKDTSEAILRDTAVALTGACRSGLPNFIGSMLLPIGSSQTACSLPRANFSTVEELCASACIQMNDKSVGNIDQWHWLFEGGVPSISSERSPRRVCFPVPGVFTIRLIVSNSYGADTAFSTVRVFPGPNVSIDSVDEICSRESIQLQARGALTYEWSPASLVSEPFLANPVVSPSSTTRFTVIGTNKFGCKDTSTMLVRVVSMEASDSVTICAGASTQLVAVGATTYRWLPVDGLDDPTSSTPIATPRVTTRYVVQMERGSCVALDTVLVQVVDSFDVKIIGADRTCVGDTLVLYASAGTSHEWSGIGVVDRFASIARVVMGNNSTMIHLVSRSGGCESSDSLFVQPVIGPSISIGVDVRVCQGESTILTATTTASDVVWTPSVGLDGAAGSVVRCTPLSTQMYVASARGDSGCVGSDTVLVEVISRPLVEAGNDLSICTGGAVEIPAFGNADRYEWSPSVGLSDVAVLRPTVRTDKTTTYVVRALRGQCETLDTVTVYVSNLELRVTADTLICAGDSIQLRASGASSYLWSPQAGLSDPTIAAPIAHPTVTTTYQILGTDLVGCTQMKSVTVSVEDRVLIRLIAGSVTARAGTDGLGVPILLDVPQALLPLTIKEIRATLVHDASVFLPDSTDRGALRTSLRGSNRLSYLLVENIQVISSRQKITEVRGTVLAGRIETAPMTWEDVTWSGTSCPTISNTGGLLYISGCNIAGRTLRSLVVSSVTARPSPSHEGIEAIVRTQMPGEYSFRLIDIEGRVIWSTVLTQSIDQIGSSTSVSIEMSRFSSGVYALTAVMPDVVETIPLVWVK